TALRNHLLIAEQKVNNPVTETPQAAVSTSPSLNPQIDTQINTQTPIQSLSPSDKEKYKEESSGKILGKIGIGALILGVAFFLKYAFDNNWIGPTGRVLVGLLIGAILISLGQHFRKKYDMFAEVMFGGGIAILYLSFYAAHYFYNLIDPVTTGLFMLLVTALTFIFSFINQDSKLAVLATVGGFLTPYIIGATGNNMVEVFFYLIILNIGVLSITLFKKWPELVALALVGTGINFMTWFGNYYNESVLGSTIFFLILTFLIFLSASLYRIIIEKVKSAESDYFVLLANAFGFFGLFYNLMKPNHEPMLGFYTLILALVYIAVAYVANKQNREDTALNIFLPGLAVAFLSLAVPIQFSGAYIAILWFVEACVLYLIALSISNRGFQVMGAGVYALGVMNFIGWNAFGNLPNDFSPIFNKAFGILVIAIISAYVISYIYYKYGSITAEIQKQGVMIFIIVANIITLYAFSTQIIYYYNVQNQILARDYANSQKFESVGNNNSYYVQNTNNNYQAVNTLREAETTNKNKSNTTLSIFWAIYAIILT
ncbi:MAG: DUF2339 domain-containing protein, partial [Betaproteobacteria bacterium]